MTDFVVVALLSLCVCALESYRFGWLKTGGASSGDRCLIRGRTLLMGALFGFFAYATYDLSNLATPRNWPVRLTLIDLVWGSLLTAAVAGAGKAAMNWESKA
jgi:hypothetical protein